MSNQPMKAQNARASVSQMSVNTPGFKQRIIARAPGLLEMFYKPSELASELGVTHETIRNWIANGLPFEEVDEGRMVVGTVLALWISEKYQKKAVSAQTPKDFGYCFKCNQSVKMVNPIIKTVDSILLKQGNCPFCGTKVNRGMSMTGVFNQ